jgi:hypothetical protein
MTERVGDLGGIFQSEPGKMHPSYREEDQEMAQELKPVVMGPPAYASPNADTLAGRLVPVEEHPLSADLSDDYGAAVVGSSAEAPVVTTDSYESTMTPEEGLQAQAKAKSQDAPENREEWTKANWQDQARAYGLSTSGNKDDLREAVEAYEGEMEADKKMTATEWVEEIEKAGSADDLASIRERYGAAEASFKTADDAFEKKQAEFDADSGDSGDGDQS